MLTSSDATHSIFITLLILIPSTLAAVDCRSACHACHAKEQPVEMLEIYCAMCQECKERRKERIKARIHLAQMRTSTERISVAPGHIPSVPFNIYVDPLPDYIDGADIGGSNVIQDIPPGCPTPPPCSDDEEPHKFYVVRTTTTTTTTTTTPRPTCPPIKPCKKKKHSIPMPCLTPCCPAPPCPPSFFPYPYPFSPPPGFSGPSFIPPFPVLATKTTAPSTPTEPDYMYMYVGVPKNMLREKR